MRKLTPILLLTFVNVIGFTLLIPVLPEVLEKITGGGSGVLYGALLSAYAFSQFLAAPVLGSLSDRYGRRPILLLSQLGTTLSWVIFGAAFFIPMELTWGSVNIALLVITFSRVIDGLTGGNISVAQAWLSDKTTAEEKTKAFGLIGATFGVGFMVGPALGGFSVSTSIHFLGTALFAFSLSLVTLGIMYWGLPESLPKKKRHKSVEKSLVDHLKFGEKFKLFRKHPIIANLLEVRVIYSVAFVGFTTSIILLAERTYDLSSIQIGLLMTVIGLFSIFNQAVIVPWLDKRWRPLKIFFAGLLISGISLGLHTALPLLFGTELTTTALTAFLILSFPSNLGFSMAMTTFRTIISKNTPEHKQGQAMGLDGSISAFGEGVTPLFAGLLYDGMGFFAFVIYGGALLLMTLKAYIECFKKNHIKG